MSTKTKLIVAGFVLLLFLVIGIVVYRSGKKTGNAQGAINVAAPVNDASGSGALASLSELKSLAQAIHDDLAGINFLGHNIEVWQRVLVLSDTDFARLYTEFDQDFQKESGQTLKQWVAADTDSWQPGSKWGTIRDTLLQRMTKLNLV